MKRTPLYPAHVAAGARLVDFAGWEMPLSYPGGISTEHLAVRRKVGLFDVSHMGEVHVTGEGATDFLRYATLNDPAKLKAGRGQYSMLPNDTGGLIDDFYVYRDGEDDYQVICNAANTGAVSRQLQRLSESYAAEVTDESDKWALLALQGPEAASLMAPQVADDLNKLKKNRRIQTELLERPVRLSRTGYTGEDGFEILCRPEDAVIIWDVLLEAGAVPCGLGARDTLRLEAGFALYGHELSATTNPLCTGYAWVVKDKPFFGRKAMWGKSCESRLVGLVLERGVAREGYGIFAKGERIGTVTSGTISPLTKKSIAMGWLKVAYAEPGQRVAVEIRGRQVAATVTRPPFYP
jgi:aminomethyltransferase